MVIAGFAPEAAGQGLLLIGFAMHQADLRGLVLGESPCESDQIPAIAVTAEPLEAGYRGAAAVWQVGTMDQTTIRWDGFYLGLSLHGAP